MRSSFIWCIQFSLCLRILLCRISLCDSVLTLVCNFFFSIRFHMNNKQKREKKKRSFEFLFCQICLFSLYSRSQLLHLHFREKIINETIIWPFVSCCFSFLFSTRSRSDFNGRERLATIYTDKYGRVRGPNIYAIGQRQRVRPFAANTVAILCIARNLIWTAGTSS